MKTTRASMHVSALCRGAGVGYLALSMENAPARITVFASTSDGRFVPSRLYRTDLLPKTAHVPASLRDAWVVVVPLLARDVRIALMCGDKRLANATFPALRSKFFSRMLASTKPEVAAFLRSIDDRMGFGQTRVDLTEVWPANDGNVVWRVRATFPTSMRNEPAELRVFDSQTNDVGARVVVMEDQVAPSEHDPSQLVRLVTFSCTLPADVTSFYVLASVGENGQVMGFAGMNAPRAQGMLAMALRTVGGAAADPEYEDWFLRHRATDAELARQRLAFGSLPACQRPLLSIVMPVFRPKGEFLRAAIDSVLTQSYANWELVVVNASGDCEEVDAVLARCDDKRVRVLTIKNRSIAQNTNRGIAAARGAYVGFLDHDDVLEPDALWHYAQAIGKAPETDLIYCDEDHLRNGHVHAPAFKTFPNYGKLYTHNYVTHFLMVSRRVLDKTERSGEDVSGAQDYDLTLKAFEVARKVTHVPRVLYHWREHEASTASGSDQKPYAHEAGRRALCAHLERRSIAATVEDGPLPYTYEVRYELPDPAPMVSIVIPTRDQRKLLNACVRSILKKTSYKHYEIVLVENNSRERATFALYDKLRELSERVHVTTWQPPEPGVFNYSAIVNHGVSYATGDFVVLLNNDTEVIAEDWLEQMLGCFARPEVGVVGAKLLYADGLIQHVGMIANPSGGFCHVCQNLTADALGPAYAAAMPGDYSMVTGACQMVRRSVFNDLGGYDEQLAVGFNDGDFCLRAGEAGMAVTVAPRALLTHREFSTRGREATDARLKSRYVQERARIMGKHPSFFAAGDPALNPNLDGYGVYLGL